MARFGDMVTGTVCIFRTPAIINSVAKIGNNNIIKVFPKPKTPLKTLQNSYLAENKGACYGRRSADKSYNE